MTHDGYVKSLERALRWYIQLDFCPSDLDLGGCFSWPQVAQAALDGCDVEAAIASAEFKV
jgi:hypothetical protein